MSWYIDWDHSRSFPDCTVDLCLEGQQGSGQDTALPLVGHRDHQALVSGSPR